MSEVSPIQSVQAGRSVSGPAAPGRDAQNVEPAPLRRGTDRVEVSAVAMFMSKLRQLPPVRQDLVDQMREQIASGTYDTPEKLDAAIDEMLRDAEL